jgi:hypothetical protein
MALRENNPHLSMAKEYTAYLKDPNVYPPHITPANGRTRINNSALTRDEERQLSEKWHEIEMRDVKNTVYTFKVAEPHKQRCRVVHACHVNEKCKNNPNGPTPFKLKSADEVNSILQGASHVTQFDARSMYDQFTLAEAVAAHFVFRDREGRLVALNRLPGFCYACGIAQSLSLILTSFQTENEWYDVHVIVHLDNYLFAFTSGERHL